MAKQKKNKAESAMSDIRLGIGFLIFSVLFFASTFFFRVDGVSMVDAGMDEGDILIVDRAVEPYSGCKAVCFIDGEYTVKQVEIGPQGIRLLPANGANAKYRPIVVRPEDEFLVWGVVTYVIKKL